MLLLEFLGLELLLLNLFLSLAALMLWVTIISGDLVSLAHFLVAFVLRLRGCRLTVIPNAGLKLDLKR